MKKITLTSKLELENAINSVTTNTSKEELHNLVKSLQINIKDCATKLGILVSYADINDVKEFKKSLTDGGSKFKDVLKLDDIVSDINYTLAKHIISLAKSDLRQLLEGKLFACKSLNLAIPQLKLYNHVEQGELSGVQCSITEKSYKLSQLIENNDKVENARKGLSYRLLTQEEYNDVVDYANKLGQTENGTAYSIRIKFYKGAIGLNSNKYYKNLLNELTKEVANIVKADNEQLSPKMFNISCLEWIASKCVKDNRSVSFRALKSFDVDTVLFNYVRCALFSHDELGLIK